MDANKESARQTPAPLPPSLVKRYLREELSELITLDATQAGDVLNICREQVVLMIKAGTLGGYRSAGTRWRIPLREVRAYQDREMRKSERGEVHPRIKAQSEKFKEMHARMAEQLKKQAA